MSNSISTLLLRNLSDVFGENDPVRRRAAIDEIFHEDAVFYDPQGGIFRGPDEIDRSNQFPKQLESAVTAAPAILLTSFAVETRRLGLLPRGRRSGA
jgi:hypothetical protein